MVGSTGKDGVVKLWNMFDFEFHLQFSVPKEECVAIAMHQFKPYLVLSHSDGFVRFFEISRGRSLGRYKVGGADQEDASDYVVAMRILPSGNHIMAATLNGLVFLMTITSWDPLGINIESLASINTQVVSFEVSFLEPYNKWIIGTGSGKAIVYNRKDFNSFKQEVFDEEHPAKFNFMDSFNLIDYIENNFAEARRTNTLDHYYQTAPRRTLVQNDVAPENEVEGIFASNDLAISICCIKKCNYLFFRNFELHQVTKKVELGHVPLSLQISVNSGFVFVLLKGMTNYVKLLCRQLH